jgi:hypothetical protein
LLTGLVTHRQADSSVKQTSRLCHFRTLNLLESPESTPANSTQPLRPSYLKHGSSCHCKRSSSFALQVLPIGWTGYHLSFIPPYLTSFWAMVSSVSAYIQASLEHGRLLSRSAPSANFGSTSIQMTSRSCTQLSCQVMFLVLIC